ncbi:ABC transporter substrate-binding protein [Methylobacterium indicum]|uniref:ABC transporter substrate-binding protein n=1 Tax=Methylobacterium indicum TaxID=1775910 RepID=A0ABR5HDY0_9HYPH|nr:ABC transporter substrate-binding protein [Methylobacterium indicum]KMO24118.1 ABC transporter substrate-binding protein [Methylobacterium indicum]KMO24534.1 ABC transporter substrate-binding protein [Methylobacterium indicum]
MTPIRTTASRLATALLCATVLAGPAAAQGQGEGSGKVRVGLMFTLSGPSAVLGEQGRDGFLLALDSLGKKLGGLDVEVVTVDDELKPDVATNKARELVKRDKVDFVVGPTFSNVLRAVVRPVTDGGAFLISPNAGTSNYAGAECNPNLFVSSYQNDQVHEVLGKYAQNKGYKRLVLLAPNYQAGKDSLAGFKHSYKGEVVNEMFTPLGQLDFSAELAQISAAQPDAVFAFMPGGMGVNLVRQYRQAGLSTIPFLSAFTVDESTLPAQKDAAVGYYGGANWAPDLDNPQSKAFVAAYEKKYGSVPGTYAMQAYDAALMIDAAVKRAKGDLKDKDSLRAGLKAAEFQSLRGNFKIGNNHYPIQDFYLVKAAKRPDGKYETQIAEKIFSNYQDNYAAECKMK